jgi:hypothetical protein
MPRDVIVRILKRTQIQNHIDTHPDRVTICLGGNEMAAWNLEAELDTQQYLAHFLQEDYDVELYTKWRQRDRWGGYLVDVYQHIIEGYMNQAFEGGAARVLIHEHDWNEECVHGCHHVQH